MAVAAAFAEAFYSVSESLSVDSPALYRTTIKMQNVVQGWTATTTN
jgi:hypothetical protein